jgi:hypothetical protein
MNMPYSPGCLLRSSRASSTLDAGFAELSSHELGMDAGTFAWLLHTMRAIDAHVCAAANSARTSTPSTRALAALLESMRSQAARLRDGKCPVLACFGRYAVGRFDAGTASPAIAGVPICEHQ